MSIWKNGLNFVEKQKMIRKFKIFLNKKMGDYNENMLSKVEMFP